ncbi:MAG TPA: MarR family transcriptional regulator [Steroidobacteraceae bacterium]|nr:MarR family transcriptional regulator [Steroidobacteraceae bacterium]
MAGKHYDSKTFTTAASIGYLLKLAQTLMVECVSDAFTDRDISFMQWIVLMKLREGAAMTASDLCREMRHDTGALTRLLDQLEERGYIVRERSKEDRRVVQLQLTPAGRKQAVDLIPLAVERLNIAVGDFSKAEFNEFARLLSKLIDKLRDVQQSRQAGAS